MSKVYVTATKREFLNIFKTLMDTKNVKDTTYAKAVVDNSESIIKHLEDLEEMSKPSQEFIDVAIKANKIIESGDQEALAKYEEENKEVVEARKSQLDKVNAKLEEITSLELVLLEETNLPSDLDADQLASLKPIIKK
jgi:hypothetical protein